MHYSIRHSPASTYDAPSARASWRCACSRGPSSVSDASASSSRRHRAPTSWPTAIRWATSSITSTFPAATSQLTVTAEAMVEFVGQSRAVSAAGLDAWPEIDAVAASWRALGLSRARPFRARVAGARGSSPRNARPRPVARSADVVRAIGQSIHEQFAYGQQVTHVDSPIEERAGRRGRASVRTSPTS